MIARRLIEEVTRSGGGGGSSSNMVSGTFKGTAIGAMDINLDYNGSGYPIAVVIYPSEGTFNNTSGTFYNLVHRYACGLFAVVKSRTDSPPTYDVNDTTNADNCVCGINRNKTNATSATSYTATNINNNVLYSDVDASTTSHSAICQIRSKTKMSVRIAATGDRGFPKDIEYTYHVIYSQ